ncbi:conserved hypothetical protein [Bradyrhizobium sp. ORS 285]|uniref:hypothetical protein n=1 Tax=Bradyrhizobium sp. ORS 285 TaxID=115808 RepID=UPI00055634B7|nr:hypothetical protein [Bradyrhizobium sp. ORS 285]SMX62219.1 conserved hypothetical protein [Bradyrhizobium sp. ORS 285]
MVAVSSMNQISPANERVYRQSNLLGEWKGSWTASGQAVSFKVVNIRGAAATVEYTHNGRTERGIGQVNGSTIDFGAVTLGTKNGKNAVLLFSAGGGKATAMLEKQAPPASESNLLGSWAGYSGENGMSANYRVLAVNGKEAQVSVTANGITRQGTGIVYKNTIMFEQTQISTDDGKSGKVIYQYGNKSYMVPVDKLPKIA